MDLLQQERLYFLAGFDKSSASASLAFLARIPHRRATALAWRTLLKAWKLKKKAWNYSSCNKQQFFYNFSCMFPNLNIFFQFNSNLLGKVLSHLEARFDLISGCSLSMKIQIMGGKISENTQIFSDLSLS